MTNTKQKKKKVDPTKWDTDEKAYWEAIRDVKAVGIATIFSEFRDHIYLKYDEDLNNLYD